MACVGVGACTSSAPYMYCALTPRVHYLCRAVYGVGGAPHTVRRGGVGGGRCRGVCGVAWCVTRAEIGVSHFYSNDLESWNDTTDDYSSVPAGIHRNMHRELSGVKERDA